ncbi:hypothetical protein BDV32DRAFT_61630 [Aspergillus pseudonomiae]|nr:hypothetical protein BDV32DRAFT_61630 [Aspergillus pseudonomiae]
MLSLCFGTISTCLVANVLVSRSRRRAMNYKFGWHERKEGSRHQVQEIRLGSCFAGILDSETQGNVSGVAHFLWILSWLEIQSLPHTHSATVQAKGRVAPGEVVAIVAKQLGFSFTIHG